MQTEHVTAMLEAYLDNELPRAEVRTLETHLDGCAACRTALAGLEQLRLGVRDAALRHAAPAALRARIAAGAAGLHTPLPAPVAAPAAQAPPGTLTTAAHGHQRVPAHDRAPPAARHMPQRRRQRWYLAAACVAGFCLGALAVTAVVTHGNAPRAQLATPDAGRQLARDLLASHWRALAASSPVDVVSSDRHTVKPWFAGRIADAPSVRDFAEQGFPLAGGRIDYVGGARVAVLVYRHGQHLIDVFVLPPDSVRAVSDAASARGYAIENVDQPGRSLAIVADMDNTEMQAFGRLLAAVP